VTQFDGLVIRVITRARMRNMRSIGYFEGL